MVLTALRAYTGRVEAQLAPAQRTRVREREAEQLGIAPDAWPRIATANIDLVLVREIHRAVTGDRATIRRADHDGTWTVAAARPGHLRSMPQAFRTGDHVEPAWDHATLKHHLAHAVGDALSIADPVARASALVFAVTRAQPFLGDNERVAMVLAARVLRGEGLPVPRIGAIERDRGFADAVRASTSADHSPIGEYLARGIWDAALTFAEWIAPAPSTERWSLRDEHEACVRMRSAAMRVADGELDGIVDALARALVPRVEAVLASALPSPRRIEDRMATAVGASRRGRMLSPHVPAREVRWSIERASGLELVVVLGGPGRALTGAACAHAALELPGLPLRAPAPALLFVPDESVDARAARIEAWAPRALERMLVGSPVRVASLGAS